MSYYNLTKLAERSRKDGPIHKLTNKEVMESGAKTGLIGLGSGLGLNAVGKLMHDRAINKLKDELGNIKRPLTDKNGEPLSRATLGDLTDEENKYIRAKKVINLGNDPSALGGEKLSSDLYKKSKKLVDDYEEMVRRSSSAKERFDKAQKGGTFGGKIKKVSTIPILVGLAGGLAAGEAGVNHLMGRRYYQQSH